MKAIDDDKENYITIILTGINTIIFFNHMFEGIKSLLSLSVKNQSHFKKQKSDTIYSTHSNNSIPTEYNSLSQNTNTIMDSFSNISGISINNISTSNVKKKLH